MEREIKRYWWTFFIDVELDENGFPPKEMDDIRKAAEDAAYSMPCGNRVHNTSIDFDFTDDVTEEYEGLL